MKGIKRIRKFLGFVAVGCRRLILVGFMVQKRNTRKDDFPTVFSLEVITIAEVLKKMVISYNSCIFRRSPQ